MASRWDRVRGAGLSALAALVSMAALWGFTVDDALITARVAHHLATGLGHRFNPGGPVVDAVTPLGFAHLLAPFAAAGPRAALRAARVLGGLAWLGAAAWLGSELGRGGARRARYLPLALVAVSVPLGAWATAGMETGLVLALATVALARHALAPLAAGVAAGLRPELLPWAMALGIGTALARERRPGPAIVGLALATTPALVVAVIRVLVFGTATPLAALAKPAGLDDGLRYSAAGFVLTGLPITCLAPRAVRRLPPHDLAVGAATLLHFAAVALAGGDWMPSFRLLVPALPGCVWVGAALAERSALAAAGARVALGLACCLALAHQVGPASRRVVAQREQLQARGARALAGARRIATLDAGWVGVATGAEVVDVAGVTDPAVAALPGGHTSKRLDAAFLARRDVDAAVALWDDARAGWYRVNDARLAELSAAAGLARVDELPLSGSSLRYVVFRRPATP